MPIIVDTNVFIDAENDQLDLSLIPSLQSETVYIAAVTVSELLTGVKMAKTAEEQIHRHTFVENILSHVPVLDFNSEVARTYAELYGFALSQGKRSKLNVHDLQIAATALVYHYPILTSNTDDFDHIPGVRVIKPHADKHHVHEENSDYQT